MRKIKFRGKCTKQWKGSNMFGKWVYGGLAYNDQNDPVIINNNLQNHYCVDANSVGQFLEITDNDCIDIYEGDILKFTYEHTPNSKAEYVGYVAVEDGSAIVVCDDFPDGYILLFNLTNTDYDCLVIGNVTDNKSLLD